MALSGMMKDVERRGIAAHAMLIGAILALPLSVRVAAQTSAATPPASTISTPQQAAPEKLTPKEARDAQIAAEAQKLFDLAVDLKIEMDKANKDTVSLAVVKKAAEIEKLAKTLQQHLRAE